VSRRIAIRGDLLDLLDDPGFDVVDSPEVRFDADHWLLVEDGRIAGRQAHAPDPSWTRLDHSGRLVMPGFIDTHVHSPQLDVIASYGTELLDWLNTYTFPAESRFSDPAHATRIAGAFLDLLLAHGTTTAVAYCSSHPASVDAYFEAAEARGLRMIGGKVMMDRNAPPGLLDTATSGYDESKALIGRWHGRDRLAYAITPRFAATSTPAQLEAAGALWRETPGAYLHSHVAENVAEVEWISALYPSHARYLDVYAQFGLLGRRALYAHGIHLDDADFQLLHESQTAIAHCPTSNNFLGSGLFSMHRARDPRRPVHVALATDLGGGTTFSMLRTMQAASEVAQLGGHPLSPSSAWWLATRGAAEALDLGERIGAVEPGRDADLVVIDLRSTPLIDFRMQYIRGIEEALAVQFALGDDRAIRATYIAGHLAWDRDAAH